MARFGMKRVNDEPYVPNFEYEDDVQRACADHGVRYLDHCLANFARGTRQSWRGRPYAGASNSFRAFVIVAKAMGTYRSAFGVKRVPEAETRKFIAYTLRKYPDADEETVREFLREKQHALSSPLKANTYDWL
jgi:hypothetical protein